ncbi:MAG TPA: Hsp70 family protein, partial [Nannocystis sp.]
MSNLSDPGALFQIAEPSGPAPAPRAPGRGIGIDLGTTHSLVAIAPQGAAPRVLRGDGRALVPSVVSYTRALDRPLVGDEAI